MNDMQQFNINPFFIIFLCHTIGHMYNLLVSLNYLSL